MHTIEIQCPTLGGQMVGEENLVEGEVPYTGVVSFRGIPYASVSKRWTQSRVQHSLSGPPLFHATQFGAKCPQPPHISLIQVAAKAAVVEIDEFRCLNLNVTAPSAHIRGNAEKSQNEESSLLPVMVWVHGGAFKNGSNSNPRYNPETLARVARDAGQPVILVQMNYRLGVFGFAASADLASEHKSATSTDSDYFANFGLVDQRNAFEWIQAHIRDFGGDPSNVTAFGVSAGSASLHMHILSGKPLFDRAILMSGTGPAMGPVPLIMCESVWGKLSKAAEISGDNYEKRLEQLRSLSQETVIEKCGPRASFGPLGDGNFLPSIWRLGDPHPVGRCRDIIIGDVGCDGIVFDPLAALIPQNHFHAKVQASFKDPADAELFSRYFGLTHGQEQSPEAFRDATRFFSSAAIFHYPNIRIAESYSGGKAHLYHFEVPSPYGGRTHGLPVHGQCAVWAYNTEKDVWPEPAQNVSLEMAKLWTGFAYGKEPWPAYSMENKFMRLGPAGDCTLMDFENDKTRDYEYLAWIRDHFDEILRFIMTLA